MQHLQHAAGSSVPAHASCRFPRELDELVLACLQKDPNKRPQDADDLFRMAYNCRGCDGWNAGSRGGLVGAPPARFHRARCTVTRAAASDVASAVV